ncbi:uncharacterized protein G2W53_031618 [Senna tora]|uniref:Reverse transcriptase n=1 Tax=Senna tora TaxID=362788 RepID=A0A834THS7_9FABA|nr:uncharacterized protein G2W53_031618 [Senna tora]
MVMNDDLIKDVTLQEVEAAVFGLGATKAPGPDGLNVIPKEVNATYITLIPKIPDPESIAQFRPISCCNFIYKIIAKILTNRLKPIMNCLHFTSSRLAGIKKKAMILKIDMNKAYDRLEWDFVMAILKAFGFHERWVRLVMGCITSVSYKVKLNGLLSRDITPTRGVRQDDTMIMSKAEVEEAFVIQQILNQFTEASGQMINTSKSGIVFSKGTDVRNQNRIANILRMTIWNSPGKYLGLPSEWGRSKTHALSWIKEKVWQKLQGWKEKLLSDAGKETLIKAVIQAIPSYVMSVIRIPKSFCDSISAMIARFWWSKGNKQRGMHWIKWREIAKRKSAGGLGFRDFNCFKTAMLAKQAWRAQTNPEALWVQTLKSIYFPDSDFWEAKLKRGSSWMWRSLLEGRDFIKKHVAWLVGSGENINMWFDRWICSNENIWPVGNAQLDLKVKDLIIEGERRWDETKVMQLVNSNVARLIFATPIKEAGPDKMVWPFTVDGSYSVKTGYHCAIKDVTSLEEGSSSSGSEDAKIWNVIWKAKVQPKIKNFIWRLVKNAIPVKDNLARRKMKVDNRCPLCLKDSETIEHCFIYCDRARAIWFGSIFQWSNPNENNLPMLKWVENKITSFTENSGDADRYCSYFFNLLLAMWKTRNEFCFEGVSVDPVNILTSAEIRTNEFLAAQNRTLSRESLSNGSSGNSDCWSPPSPGIVKFNVDATLDLRRTRGALSTIARDHTGEVLTGYVKRFPCVSATQAEARAVREIVQICSSLDIKEAIIESDCKAVVDFCNNNSNQWQLEAILDNTKDFLKSNLGVKVKWIPRKKNMVADFLAKEALKNSLSATWVWSHPVKLRALLLKDNIQDLIDSLQSVLLCCFVCSPGSAGLLFLLIYCLVQLPALFSKAFMPSCEMQIIFDQKKNGYDMISIKTWLAKRGEGEMQIAKDSGEEELSWNRIGHSFRDGRLGFRRKHPLYHILYKIKSLIANDWDVKVVHIGRDSNKVADSLTLRVHVLDFGMYLDDSRMVPFPAVSGC